MPPTQKEGGGHQTPAHCSLKLNLSSMLSANHRRCLFLLLFFAIPSLLGAQFDYPTANLSTVWINSPSQLQHTVSFEDGSQVRSILLRRSPNFIGPTYACGFYCIAACDAFLFAVFIVYTNSGGLITNTISVPPQVVWSANRDHLVKANAILNLTAGGDLILKDADGTAVWSTGTSGGRVTGLNITESGNLVLFDRNDRMVWQSFDHPTDSLVLGQTLKEGQRLTANISLTNWTQGQVYLTVLSDGLYAFAASNPPQSYYKTTFSSSESTKGSAYVRYTNGSLDLFLPSTNSTPDSTISLPPASTAVQFMRLEYDGHLRVFEWNQGWHVIGDVLGLDACDYPTVCGEYGICFNGQCSCPVGSNATSGYFKPVSDRQSNLGCSPVIPLSCQSLQEHRLLEASDVSYFSYNGYQNATFQDIDEESCKQACLRNCSCKAALFRYGGNVSNGECFLPSQLFSLQNNQPSLSHYNSTAYIKVQVPASRSPNFPPSGNYKKHTNVVVIIAIVVPITAAFVIGGIAVVCVRRGKNTKEEDDDLEKVSGMPRRFSFEELRSATDNFSKMLGQGGFGSVYEGNTDDEKIAVKRLGRGKGKQVMSKKEKSQEKKDFLAEVKTIGSVHHINLVRMVGFCAEKSERLLVYEYMCNGSLDKWIYTRGQDGTLDWQTKRRIISDIAKGLCYLHEECRQKIVHSDIKPQNILLDDKFNAKISDFGLAKLIDRDKIEVSAVMDGTIGYIAPERRSGLITERVDTYSFGVVVVEIVCGRKNLDDSQPAESFHLLGLLQELMKSNRLKDIVDMHSNGMQLLHRQEAVEMIKLAVWCLQGDSSRRPSMSTVVKVLEGSADVETDLGHNFSTAFPILYDDFNFTSHGITSPSASLLPGPH